MRIILKVGDKALLLQEGVDVKDAVNLIEGATPVKQTGYHEGKWADALRNIEIEVLVIPDSSVEQPVIEDDFIPKEDIEK